MPNNYLPVELHSLRIQDSKLWFQQNHATSHITRILTVNFKRIFPNGMILHNGDIDWPPRTPDLITSDIFFTGIFEI